MKVLQEYINIEFLILDIVETLGELVIGLIVVVLLLIIVVTIQKLNLLKSLVSNMKEKLMWSSVLRSPI